MSDPKHLALLVAFIVATCLFGAAHGDLKGTTILFRHGQRTPVSGTADLDNSLTEELGEGQLTNIGSRQLYENGALLRLKYKDLFPKDGFFRLSNMKILTSVPERTMMSLQSFMAGFFPPPLLDTTLPIWWQPFFTKVDHEGKVVYMTDNCPKFTKFMYSMLANPPKEVNKWFEQDKEILDKLSAWANVPLNNAMEVMEFAEYLKAQSYLDKTMPDWVIAAYQNTLKKYIEFMFALMHGSEEMIRIRGGPLITEILSNFDALISGQNGHPIMIYSAHDMTVLSLAYVLGVADQIPGLPNYSDTFMLDLEDDGSVRVVYMNTEKWLNTRTVMNVPGCGTSCSLATFRKVLSDMIVEDLDALCKV